MITDLPKEYPLQSLMQMDIGDAEARDDDLLLKCATPLPLFAEITSGKKDIIHGYRGTGKSSIVRLLAEGALAFDTEPGFVNHVLVIDEELEYRSIRDYLRKQAEHGTSESLLLRVVWEILICYRSMRYVQESISDSDSTLRDNINEIEVLFGISKRKVGLIELLLSQKKKVGVKLDSNLPSIVDMYAGLEPATPQAEQDQVSILKLLEHVRHLVRLLHERKMTLHVLLDRLDDFVVQEDYDTQRALLQQLLACQAEYRSKHGKGRMRVFTFLRTDLFARIDQQPLGPDKIAQRSLEIRWTTADIRRFIAKRLALNLLRALKRDSLQIEYAEFHCWVTRDELAKLEETETTLRAFDVFKKSHWEKAFWLWKIFKRRSDSKKRLSSSDNVFNEAIITTLLPVRVNHLTLHGERREIELFEYLDSHFRHGFGQVTPRIVLLFLSQVIRETSEYYSANADLKVQLDSFGRYNLFNTDILLDAYASCQAQMWEIQLQIAGAFRPLMLHLGNFRGKDSFTFKGFVSSANVAEDAAKQFLGFCTHTGVLACVNPGARFPDREYKIPVLYQRAKTAA